MRTLLTVAVLAALVPSVCGAAECTVAQLNAGTADCTSLRLRPSDTMSIEHARELTEKEATFVRVRNAGIAMTFIGVAATVAGAVMFTSQICFDDCNDSPDAELIGNAGIGLLAAGQVSAVAGISMWASGGANASKEARARVQWTGAGAKVTF